MGFSLTIKYYEFYGFLWIGSFCSIEFCGCVLPCFKQLLDLGRILKHNPLMGGQKLSKEQG